VPVAVGTILLVVAVVLLARAARADRAVKRWTHTTGTVREATKAHLADDGRRWWEVRVSYRGDMGEEHDGWARQLGDDTGARLGGSVDVWYDPRRPDRCHISLAGNAPGSSWLQYALGVALLVAGAAVLLRALG
jgi:hypothetical protein